MLTTLVHITVETLLHP